MRKGRGRNRVRGKPAQATNIRQKEQLFIYLCTIERQEHSRAGRWGGAGYGERVKRHALYRLKQPEAAGSRQTMAANGE